MNKPSRKTVRNCFSCGPTAKPPPFNVNSSLSDALLGRSHRSLPALAKLKASIEESKELLEVPESYHVGILVGSDTAAFEAAMWSLLGPKAVQVFTWEIFGRKWFHDLERLAKYSSLKFTSYDTPYYELPDLNAVSGENDIIFTWNGTAAGLKVPYGPQAKDDDPLGSWLPLKREGLTFCDATSAAFAMKLPWNKLDVVTYSWQKVLGGEAAHGVLILSPRAVERLESNEPLWPIPSLFILKGPDGKLNKGIFDGVLINTPSLLCTEDVLFSIKWAKSVGGLDGLVKRNMDNFSVLQKFVETHPWIHFSVKKPEQRATTSVTLSLDLPIDKIRQIPKMLDAEGVAYDIANHADAPVGLRIWCGPTVDKSDLEILMEWIDWAYHSLASS